MIASGFVCAVPLSTSSTLHAQPRRDSGGDPRVVRLDAADRDERVGPLHPGGGPDGFELADLVAPAAEGDGVVALDQQARTATDRGAQPRQLLHGCRGGKQGHARDRLQAGTQGRGRGRVRVRDHGVTMLIKCSACPPRRLLMDLNCIMRGPSDHPPDAGEGEVLQLEEVHQEIKRRIVHGRYAPGAVLSESVLARVHHTSRTPVREALSRLFEEGYVERVPRKGYTVAPLTIGVIKNTLEVRRVLEATAAGRAAERADAETMSACGRWPTIPSSSRRSKATASGSA